MGRRWLAAVVTALVTANQDLAQLRSLQDWYLRYPLTSMEGVSEVAPIGGFVKQYQVVIDPEKLRAFGVALKDVISAIQRSVSFWTSPCRSWRPSSRRCPN